MKRGHVGMYGAQPMSQTFPTILIDVCTRHGRHQAICPGGQEPTGGPRNDQICFIPYLYWARSLVERFSTRSKQCHLIATRHDKLAASYLAFVQLASIGCGSGQMSLRPSVGGEDDAACVCLHEGFLTSS